MSDTQQEVSTLKFQEGLCTKGIIYEDPSRVQETHKYLGLIAMHLLLSPSPKGQGRSYWNPEGESLVEEAISKEAAIFREGM